MIKLNRFSHRRACSASRFAMATGGSFNTGAPQIGSAVALWRADRRHALKAWDRPRQRKPTGAWGSSRFNHKGASLAPPLLWPLTAIYAATSGSHSHPCKSAQFPHRGPMREVTLLNRRARLLHFITPGRSLLREKTSPCEEDGLGRSDKATI